MLVLTAAADSRSRIVRSVAAIGGIDTVLATSLTDAASILEQSSVELVVCDLDLTGGDGTKLLDETVNLRSVPVVFIATDVSTTQEFLPPSSPLLRKPIAPHLLRETVRSNLPGDRDAGNVRDGTLLDTANNSSGSSSSNSSSNSASDALRGTSGDYEFHVADYVQLCCLGQHSIELTILSDGVAIGRIVVVGGKLWFVADACGTGEAALMRLAFTRAHIHCRAIDAPPSEQNIDAGWQELLLCAAATADEHVAAPSRDEDRATNPPDLQQLLDQGIDSLIARDFGAAAEAFAAVLECEPDNGLALANLERLSAMGTRARGVIQQ